MAQPIAKGRAGVAVTRSLMRLMVQGARRVRPERGRVGKALRIVVCVVGPLVGGLALGDVQTGLAISFGGFTGFHGHVEPYPQRARLLAAMALGYVIAVLAGTAAEHSEIAAVVVTGAFAASAAFVCQALALPAPREYMLVLICLLVGALPVPIAPPLQLAALTAVGGLWAWLVLMSGWLVDRERPEREAVRTALRASIRLVGARGRSTVAGRRHDAVLATRTARRAVEFAGGPTAQLLRDVQLSAEDLLDSALGLRRPDPEDAASVAHDEECRVVMRRRLGRLIEATDAALPEPGFRRAPKDPARPPLRSGLWSLRNAVDGDSLVPPTALRFGVAVAGGLAIGMLVGLPRPYWIALTVAAVLQGETLLTTARRAIERATGTAAGILIAAVIVAFDPGSWWIVAGVGVFLFLAQMTIVTSYAVAVMFITPMTLLLSEIGAPGALTDSLAGWRLVDTLIGCVLAFMATRLLWPSSARERLDRALERALAGVDALLDLDDRERAGSLEVGSITARWMLGRETPEQLRARRMAAGRGRRGRAAAARATRPQARREPLAERRAGQRAVRHELRVRLLNLRSVTDAALGDRFTSAPREDALWPISAAVQQVGYRTLARRHGPTNDLRREVARIRAELETR